MSVLGPTEQHNLQVVQQRSTSYQVESFLEDSSSPNAGTTMGDEEVIGPDG